MPAKKGTRPPNAGKRGRKPGTPNVVTRTTREIFAAFVEKNIDEAQALYDRVKRKNPAMALRILSSFSDFVLPRMQRAEMNIKTEAPIQSPSLMDLDPTEAARQYREFISGTNIEFAAPKHPPEFYKERNAARWAAVHALSAPPAPPALARPPEPPAPSPPERPSARPRPLKVVDPDDPSVVAEVNPEAAADAILRHQRPPYVLT